MSLETIINRKSYAGNGVTVAFSFPYYFLLDADLKVVLRDATGVETTQTIVTHYNITGAAVPAGGTVTMVTAPATGETLVIYRDPEQTQDLDLVENDNLPAEEVEKRFDKLTMIAQRLSDRIDRSVILKETDSSAQLTIPLTADRLSKFLAFDASGDLIAADTITTVPVTAFAATLLDDNSAAEVLATLGVSVVRPNASITFLPAQGSAETAAVEDIENGRKVFKFLSGDTQKIKGLLKVPTDYTAGRQILLKISIYSPSSGNTILLTAVATLIRKNTDAVTSTTNQRTSTNTALTNTVANMARETSMDLTSAIGEINSVAVSPGDEILIEITRGSDSDTADIRFCPDACEVAF